MSDPAATDAINPLSAMDFHVLMVLAEGPSYGYAIMKAVVDHSDGAVSPDVGSLYRVLARLMGQGWVTEAGAPADAPAASRGRARRYYALTPEGRTMA
ncbi:MAG: PadR family transcriptional regulator, partial [Gemmatimonadales bacterium]